MHNIFTFMAKVRPERVVALQDYLKSVRAQTPAHRNWPFKELTKAHFASLLVVTDPQARFAPYLVFENNIDGTIASYIEQLIDVMPTGLHEIFSSCVDYEEMQAEPSYLRAYLRAHVLRPTASFVGNVGRDVARIKSENDLVAQVETSADRLVATPTALSPQATYHLLRGDVERLNPWALQPKGRLSRREMLKRGLRFGLLVAPVALALVIVPATLALIALWSVLRLHEMRDKPLTKLLPQSELAKLTAHEDCMQQNHFASVSLVKPGLFRQLVLRLVLAGIDRFAALQVRGTLSNLDNIHFAHWVLIDGGRRLMFLTNYDGSWENYLDDFIDKAATGLTAIWSNAQGFPRTRNLVCSGATDERLFKNIARKTQVQTAVFYSAYGLTVPTIDNNSAIRDGLATPPQGAELERLLQRL